MLKSLWQLHFLNPSGAVCWVEVLHQAGVNLYFAQLLGREKSGRRFRHRLPAADLDAAMAKARELHSIEIGMPI